MSELYNDEFLNAFPTDVFPIAATIPERVSEEAPALVRRVGLGFIIAYAAAYFGSWIAILTPVVVTLALRIQQINPAGKAASLSLVLGVGAIFALLANPVFGKLSDRTRSRFGMRRPWLIAGVISGAIGCSSSLSRRTSPWCSSAGAWPRRDSMRCWPWWLLFFLTRSPRSNGDAFPACSACASRSPSWREHSWRRRWSVRRSGCSWHRRWWPSSPC